MSESARTVIGGRYQIITSLGKGGMGLVYKAYDPVLDRAVALKRMIATVMDSDELRQRFHIEARAAARLNHPNIVTIYELEEHAGDFYIVMELLEGVSLASFLRHPVPLSLAGYLTILAQVAQGLHYAHGRAIVHRDIKPANLVMTTSGGVKILDFGIAQLASNEITQKGAMLGTPHYMAPEQVRGEPVDARADLFALGAVAYELVTGVKAFTADSVAALLMRITEMPHTPVRDVAPDTSPALAEIIDRLLSKDRAQRPWNGDELCQALERIGEIDRSDLVAEAVRAVLGPMADQTLYAPFVAEPSPIPRSAAAAGGRVDPGVPQARARRGSRAAPVAIAAVLLLAFAGTSWWAYASFQRMRATPIASNMSNASSSSSRAAKDPTTSSIATSTQTAQTAQNASTQDPQVAPLDATPLRVDSSNAIPSTPRGTTPEDSGVPDVATVAESTGPTASMTSAGATGSTPNGDRVPRTPRETASLQSPTSTSTSTSTADARAARRRAGRSRDARNEASEPPKTPAESARTAPARTGPASGASTPADREREQARREPPPAMRQPLDPRSLSAFQSEGRSGASSAVYQESPSIAAAVARITYTLEAYSDAVAQRDLDALREVRSPVTAAEAALVKAADSRVRFTNVNVRVNGTDGLVRCRRAIVTGGKTRSSGLVEVHLTRRPAGWVITDIR